MLCLVKNVNLSKPFYGPIDHPPPHQSFKLQCQNSSQGEIFFLKLGPFLAPGHNVRRFGVFVPGSTYFLQHFQGLKKQPKIRKCHVMHQSLCRTYRDPDGPRKENDHSEKRPRFLVLFSGSCYTKIPVSITTDQLARSRLIAGENDSLGGQEPEKETNNFGRCLLGCADLNWIMTGKVVGIVIWFSYS